MRSAFPLAFRENPDNVALRVAMYLLRVSRSGPSTELSDNAE